MSKVGFHARHRAANLQGSERAYFGFLARDTALSALNLLSHQDKEWVRSFSVGMPDYALQSFDDTGRDWIGSWSIWACSHAPGAGVRIGEIVQTPGGSCRSPPRQALGARRTS